MYFLYNQKLIIIKTSLKSMRAILYRLTGLCNHRLDKKGVYISKI